MSGQYTKSSVVFLLEDTQQKIVYSAPIENIAFVEAARAVQEDKKNIGVSNVTLEMARDDYASGSNMLIVDISSTQQAGKAKAMICKNQKLISLSAYTRQ